MLQVLIYHSDRKQAIGIRDALAAYFCRERCEFRIVTVCTPAEFMQQMLADARQLDFCFLDCERVCAAACMATELKRRNPHVQWACTHTTAENCLRLLPLQPSAFLPQPAEEAALGAAMRLMRANRYGTMKCYAVRRHGEVLRVVYSSIECFESSGHDVLIHTDDEAEPIRFAARLQQIEEKLPYGFLRCHQSYIVNLEKVRSLDVGLRLFLLRSGRQVEVSRRALPSVKDAFVSYVNRMDEE